MTTEEKGKALVAGGWRQTSSKYRLVARLPAGMTALEILRLAFPHDYDRIMKQAEQRAADWFCRVADKRSFPDCHQELTQEEFQAFRKAGGQAV